MSEPKVIISAVADIPKSLKQYSNPFELLWTDWLVGVEELETDAYGSRDESYRCATAKWGKYPINVTYHSNKRKSLWGGDVVEITLQEGLLDIDLCRPEKILDEINRVLPLDFHLEVYYWYTGVDRTGAFMGDKNE